MSQPVKLSDALVLDARIAGEAQARSIAGQVEFWARLGRSLDELLEGRARRALQESAERRPLSELVSTVGTTEGRGRLKAYLDSRPFPHFESHPSLKGRLIRIEQDGSRSVGRFVNRQFAVDRKASGAIAELGHRKPEDTSTVKVKCLVDRGAPRLRSKAAKNATR